MRQDDGSADGPAIRFQDSLDGIGPGLLHGFFVGWSNPPSPATHLRLLKGSDHVVLAIDSATGQVVGFVTAITDGVLSAFIPLLEVLPAYQGQGIGQALMQKILEWLDHLPNVDLMCDSDVVPFYERFGMLPSTGMVIRRPMGDSNRTPSR
ncbi:MAG: GNAT family N-acetyltransferase [Chloroflexota bacterium]|nr:GNAT family N-acetyltransferase [Chloroflexota bacterium]